MAPPRSVSPLDALRAVTEDCVVTEPQRVSVDAVRAGFLARDIESLRAGSAFPGDAEHVCRALYDGYAVSRPLARGDELSVAPSGPANREADGASRADSAQRVECGDVLDDGVFAVLPVGRATVIRSARVRVEEPPSPGEGIAGGRGSGEVRRVPRGTPLTARIRAFLLARRCREVEVHASLRAGVLAVGDELTDPTTPGAREHPELSGLWLAESLAADGIDVLPLGIAPDDPAAIREILLRCRQRRLNAIVLVGGLGDGLRDRTGEALKTLDSHVVFERVALDLAGTFAFVRFGGLDVFGLGGAPLSAAAAFDLFVRPALLARLGAARRLWDWSGKLWMLETPLPPTADGRTWRLLAARRVSQVVAREGDARGVVGSALVRAWEPESLFSPWAAGADGWAVLPPAALSPSGAVYYRPGARPD